MSEENKTNFEEILPAGSVVSLNIFKKEYKESEIMIIKRFVVMLEYI